jgi:hypothetical protein
MGLAPLGLNLFSKSMACFPLGEMDPALLDPFLSSPLPVVHSGDMIVRPAEICPCLISELASGVATHWRGLRGRLPIRIVTEREEE